MSIFRKNTFLFLLPHLNIINVCLKICSKKRLLLYIRVFVPNSGIICTSARCAWYCACGAQSVYIVDFQYISIRKWWTRFMFFVVVVVVVVVICLLSTHNMWIFVTKFTLLTHHIHTAHFHTQQFCFSNVEFRSLSPSQIVFAFKWFLIKASVVHQFVRFYCVNHFE